MITRIGWTVALFLFFLSTNCFAAINPSDFDVNGISLGSSKYEDVLTKLGEPKSKFDDDQGQMVLTHMSYRGLKISVAQDSGRIVYMMIDNSEFKTQRGVKVGATPYIVTKLYGTPQKTIINGHVYYVYNTEQESSNHLLFDMTEGYVTKIIFTSMPLT